MPNLPLESSTSSAFLIAAGQERLIQLDRLRRHGLQQRRDLGSHILEIAHE
jgi:hypothetical protein